MKFEETVEKLKTLLKQDVRRIDADLVREANKHIGFFIDANFHNSFKNLFEMKEQVIQQAIMDISSGAEQLKSGQFGVVFNKDTFNNFYTLHGEDVPGTITFTIFLKKFKAFQNFRETEADDLDQDLLNILTYRLVVFWAQLKK